MKFNIKRAYSIRRYVNKTIYITLLVFINLNSFAQKSTAKQYGIGEKSLNQILRGSLTQQLASGFTFSPFLKDYVSEDGIVLNENSSLSKTIKNTYINKTILELYCSVFEGFIKREWKSRVYGPNQGKITYLDFFILAVKDSSLYDYHLIPIEKRTKANSTQTQFCYEQIIPKSLNTDDMGRSMFSDLNHFFRIKYGTYVRSEAAVIEGYFLKRTIDKVIKEKEVRTQLAELGKRDFQNSSDFRTVIDSFYRPNGTESNTETFPYVFDVDGINGEREIYMPVWKTGDKLEDFILALNANGLEFIKGEKKIKKILITDDPVRLRNY